MEAGGFGFHGHYTNVPLNAQLENTQLREQIP